MKKITATFFVLIMFLAAISGCKNLKVPSVPTPLPTQIAPTPVSNPGVYWTDATMIAGFPARYGHTSVVFNNKMWVIAGYNGGVPLNDIWSSSDGATWTQVTGTTIFPARYQHTSILYNNQMWVIGGTDNVNFYRDVWSSSDGATWTQVTGTAGFSGRDFHT